ncbi:MAG: glycosyltransferase [bacterium]
MAKILQRRYDVEIAGPMFGDMIWGPLSNVSDVEYKSVRLGKIPKSYWQLTTLREKLDGDVIYASKPLIASFGVGLLRKIGKKTPLILDIDDWQKGFIKEAYGNQSTADLCRSLVSSAIRFYGSDSYWNVSICERLCHIADRITVANTFLKHRFGGTIVWHGRDTQAFDPGKFDRDKIRETYNLHDDRVVMFFGTLRPHKGVEDLIEAMRLINDQNVILALVGIDYPHKYDRNTVETAEKSLKGRFKGFGLQPFQRIPEFLAMANVVVIPQRRNFASLGQVPAKVFDAMAMAKPIVATNVSDLPLILNGCGWIVDPESPTQLAEAIQNVLSDMEYAEKVGWKARRKCINQYSWDAMERVLGEVFGEFE